MHLRSSHGRPLSSNHPGIWLSGHLVEGEPWAQNVRMTDARMPRFTLETFWNSVDALDRFTRDAATAAVVLLVLGALTFSFSWIVSIPAIVAGMTAVLCAIFGWFRTEHLRDVQRRP
ncbi:MAG: hypothetical protein ACM3SQ_20085 [Betaproteobacteria bacterium]